MVKGNSDTREPAIAQVVKYHADPICKLAARGVSCSEEQMVMQLRKEIKQLRVKLQMFDLGYGSNRPQHVMGKYR